MAGRTRSHLFASRSLDPKMLAERLPGVTETARFSPASTLPARRCLWCQPCTTTWAAFLDELHGRGCHHRWRTAIRKPWVRGTAGWARRPALLCTAPNRLGSDSLIDLVVFGRAAGHHLKELIKPQSAHAGTAQGQRRSRAHPASIDFRNGQGRLRPRRRYASSMQRIMSAARRLCSRTDEVMGGRARVKLGESIRRMPGHPCFQPRAGSGDSTTWSRRWSSRPLISQATVTLARRAITARNHAAAPMA